MVNHSNDSRIERVTLLGGAADQAAIDRRTALGMFCLGVGTLLGRNALGATDASVGVAGEGFMFDSPFRAVGAILDKKTLVLPSGMSLTLGQYGNPLIAPGVFHGATLSELDLKLVDRSSVVRALIRPKDPATYANDEEVAARIRTSRVWCALVDDGKTITSYDTSRYATNPPTMEINSAGALKVTHGGVEVVRFTDGVYLSELHHVDSNRMDPGALVGFFSIGNPPSESKPIVVTELDSLVIPTAESMRVTRDGLALTADSVARNVDTKTSETFVVSGKNVWRYRFFQPEGEKTVIFGAECKAHGGVNPDAFGAEWGNMGPRQFYALETAGTRTLLHPEPDLRNTLDVTALNPEKKPLFAAGFVIWGLDESGQPRTERTSLSKLGGAERVAVKGDLLSIIRADGKEDFFRITELRRKPGFAENVVDIHAIDSKGVRGDLLAPQVTSLGSFSRPHARHTNIDG